jgi:hypothetical protein
MLVRPGPDSLMFYFSGRPIGGREGDSIAAALLAAGIRATRTSAISGMSRGPYCMIGACFECLALVDGKPGVQTCMMAVREGMRVEPQDAARTI